MSTFAEFVCIAIALFIWESLLWLPLRGVALRRRRSGKWSVLDPRGLFSTRDAGVVAMQPWPGDCGLAPCQALPMIPDGCGGGVVETASGHLEAVTLNDWTDVQQDHHHLVVSGLRLRVTSSRIVHHLREAKQRGETPAKAWIRAWQRSISPVTAGREWKRWKMVSRPLRWYTRLLAAGFFAGLPVAYLYLGDRATLALALGLWCLMLQIALHLWWLGSRVYPGARPSLRMDAFLSLLVPFHAMRAAEIASVHALATTHPVGLILSTGDFGNPWLARFIRDSLHPMPGSPLDSLRSSLVRPLLAAALARCGKTLEEFNHPPMCSDETSGVGYCPRCHAGFLAGISHCTDCQGLAIRPFPVPVSR